MKLNFNEPTETWEEHFIWDKLFDIFDNDI